MGFFKEIFLKETKTGKLVNITDLDKEHYESFLEYTTKIKAAYIAELERKGGVPTRLSNFNIPLVNNSVCDAHSNYECEFRQKDNRCTYNEPCNMKVN